MALAVTAGSLAPARFGATAGRVCALLAPLLVYAAIGAELLTMHEWAPQTLRVWADPARFGYGDFDHFYESSRTLSFAGTYNPALGVLLHPLTYLSMATAFRIYFGVNVAALAGIAFLAQRRAESLPLRVAIVLGVFALPQTHWALRVGHFTEVLAFAALCGFLLSDRRPVLAGIAFSVLALKPQYLPVPLLYLLFTRNWRGAASMVGTLTALSLAGLAAMGFQAADHAGGYYVDRATAVARDAIFGQQDLLLPVQQSWQYSWRGVLLSAGVEPSLALIAQLFVLSGGAIMLCWVRCSRSVAVAAAAMGMLLLAPYVTFYNWSMIAVAAALLLGSDLRPRWLPYAMAGALFVSAVVSQDATPFPNADVFAAAETNGFYWLPPVALGVLVLLAVLGRSAETVTTTALLGGWAPQRARETSVRMEAHPRRLPRLRLASAASGLAMVIAGFTCAAAVSHAWIFAHPAGFSRSDVVGALPADFPLPADATIHDAGDGLQLPYRMELTAPGTSSEVAGAMRRRLTSGPWKLTVDTRHDGSTRLQAARVEGTSADALADITITGDASATEVTLEFVPLPVSSVPGYGDWQRRHGIVAKAVDPADYGDLR
jgi:hypothetical protein